MELYDQLGRKLIFPKKPQRIISLVPSLTELLVDLGLEDKIVGVTKFCIHPDYLRSKKTIVGGTKSVHFDRIKNLNPDLIICNKEENTPEIVSECATIAPVHVSDIRELVQVYELLEHYGAIFDTPQKTSQLSLQIRSGVAEIEGICSKTSGLRVAYVIWKNPYMAAGSDTFINAMLRLNGLENIFFEKDSRYPEVEMDELSKADLVMLSSEPFPFDDKHIKELSLDVKAKIVLVDGSYFSWYGSRLLHAFEYFKKFRESI